MSGFTQKIAVAGLLLSTLVACGDKDEIAPPLPTRQIGRAHV